MASSSPPPLPLHEDDSGARQGSLYAPAELKAAEYMRIIRECISQLDTLSPSDDPTLRNDLLLNIRKTDNLLRRVMLDAKRYAAKEQKTRELGELQHQCASTQDLVRSRYTSRAANAAMNSATVFNMHEDEAGAVDADGTRAEPYNLHLDVEFAEFFAKTKERDRDIDVAFDRIHEGVVRVNDNAHAIQDELHVQTEVMQEAEQKVDDNTDKMSSMNKKLKKAVRDLGKPRLITYCVMCVILVVLIIVIIFLAKSL